MPDLFRRFVAGTARAIAARHSRAHARHLGRQRRRARSVADQRRRADPAPGAVRDHHRRKAPQYPPPYAEHQRHPHRDRARFRRAARRTYAALRGLSAIRRAESGCTADDPRSRSTANARKALANLEKVGLSTTLVATVRKGVNDDEIGDVLRHAAQWRCVRGVNFQPVQDTGRNEGFVPDQNRIVLSEIRRAILDQWSVFGEDDMIPLPCNPEAISIGYGLRDGIAIRPVTHLFPQEMLVREAPKSVTFESHPEMRARLIELLSLSCAG